MKVTDDIVWELFT